MTREKIETFIVSFGGMGEKTSPLGEGFSLIFCAIRVQGVEDSRVREYKRFTFVHLAP